ncbi:MAG: hypothetical protein LUE22_08100 [Oscillospiraceae bacterium]|nr:hypothetical protein [Oscillospiraceae bacterium]
MIKSKRLKLICVAIMLVVVFSSVSSSLAWLSATSDSVVNYFSGGAIAITLDEAPVDANGQEISGDRVQENHYKYVAGAVLDKDPTVTVLANSEECYVYVCVDNELPSDLFSLDIDTSAWTYVSSAVNMTIYRYSTVVASSASDQELTPVFTHVTISSSLTAENIAELGDKILTVTSFAIQTASLDTDTADSLAALYFYDGVDISAIEAETPEPTATEEPEETEEPETTTEATSTPVESDAEAEATTAPDESSADDDEEAEATAVPVDGDTDGDTDDTSENTEGDTSTDTGTDAGEDSSGTEDTSNAETETNDDEDSAA